MAVRRDPHSIRDPRYGLTERAYNAVQFSAYEDRLAAMGWRFDKTEPTVWWAVCGSRGMYITPGRLLVDQTGCERFHETAKDLFMWMRAVATEQAENEEDEHRRAKAS